MKSLTASGEVTPPPAGATRENTPQAFAYLADQHFQPGPPKSSAQWAGKHAKQEAKAIEAALAAEARKEAEYRASITGG